VNGGDASEQEQRISTLDGETTTFVADPDSDGPFPVATPENVDRCQAFGEQEVLVERLPGTSHGFAMADLPVNDEAASERHFERALELWRRNLSHERVGA
jgi:hypothetical protein